MGLQIGTWNANGLMLHRQDAELLIRNNKLDILLISESHFIKTSKFKMKGYCVYSTTHPDETAHGGTVIIVKDGIRHYEMEEYRTHAIQATIIKVEDGHGSLAISSIYCPPGQKIEEKLYDEIFGKLGTRFIIGGDWNAKHTYWGSRLITPRGRVLKKTIDRLKLDVLTTGKPTHWPTDTSKMPDLLDFYVYGGISSYYLDIRESLEVDGAHLAIIATVSTTIIKKTKPLTLHNKKTDWYSFRTWIQNRLNLNINLNTIDDIDEAI